MRFRDGRRVLYAEQGHIGRAFLPMYLGDRREPLVAALAAYFDESHSNERGIYVVAGYVGHVSAFDEDFAPAWTGVLARAPRPVSEFEEFKSSNLSQCFGKFAGWDMKAEAMPFYRDVVQTLCGVLRGAKVVGVAAATVFPSKLRHEAVSLRDPGFDMSGYDCCLSFLLRNTLVVARSLLALDPEGERSLEIIYDERKEPFFTQAIKNRFNYTTGHIDLDGVRIREPRPELSHKTPAIQAADLLAFETHMEVRSRMDGKGRDVRKSLAVMVENGVHLATCIDIETLALANFAGIGPEYVPAPTLFMSGEEWKSESHWRPGTKALPEDLDRQMTALAAKRLALHLGLLP